MIVIVVGYEKRDKDDEANSHILEQLKPSPTVNGLKHEQVKFALSKLSLTQSALRSQGVDKHGSGTEIKV